MAGTPSDTTSPAHKIKEEILEKISEYFAASTFRPFVPGSTYVQNSGKLFDAEELKFGVEAILDGWWTEGRFASQFCQELAALLPAPFVSLTNSGSSSNLAACAALTSHFHPTERRLMPGDEVITVAAGFPTTINPILQCGAIPVFVDVKKETLTANTDQFEQALSEKTKAVMIAHPLGNPFDLDAVTAFCKKHNLWLIEDTCDALGSRYRGRHVGTFGDLATISFFPAHHITMGEGGAVIAQTALLDKIVKSFRDWGRDCWCATGKENTCGTRFSRKQGDLPFGYDHKFVYSHMGYNLKPTDMQAAIGLAQLKKLPAFIAARKENFQTLFTFFAEKYSDYFYLPTPEPHAEPSWFGFPLTIKENAGFTRHELQTFLDARKVGTRLLFAGNITRQPYFQSYNLPHRVVGTLEHTDYVMNQTFWIGVQPNITPEMRAYVMEVFDAFFATKK